MFFKSKKTTQTYLNLRYLLTIDILCLLTTTEHFVKK